MKILNLLKFTLTLILILILSRNGECIDINEYDYDSIYLKSLNEVISPSKDLKINEILTSNISVNHDEYDEYDDWLELYNFGDDTINLKGLYISDSRSTLTKFQISIDTLIKPDEYLIIWTDGEPEQGPLHTSFKLDGSGEKLFICTADLIVLDSVYFNEQTTNISYGRLFNDFLNWNYFSTPTPGLKNQEVGLLERIPSPSANYQSGYYNSTICVEIIHPDPEVITRYTLNGDVPGESSSIYSGCITVDKTSILRFRSFKDGYVASSTQTCTYFFEDNKDLDVISISIHNTDLTGSSGLFTTRARGVEKPVHIEYFGKDKKLKFKIDGGMQLHSPKSNPQLSVRLYARSDYGYENMDYQIFKNKNIYSFKRIILRNSGNDGIVSSTNSRTHFRDPIHHLLFDQVTDSKYMSGFQPVNVFFNGQYYGIYNARERIDKYFIESNFNYLGEMDLLERAFKFPGNKNPIEGSFFLYDSIVRFMNNNDLSINENYQFVSKYIDVNQFIDYWIHEVYIGNYDWLVNNIKIFRPYVTDSRFKWILWDTDHGSGLPYLDYGKVSWKTLNWSLSTDQSRTTGGGNTILQRKFVENEEFRLKFINRYADLLNTVYTYSNIEYLIDSIADMVKHDMTLHADRWGFDYTKWEDAITDIKNYHKLRPEYVRNDILKCFSLNNQFEVTLKTNDSEKGSIKINSIIPKYVDNEWKGVYFSDVPVSIEAVPKKGYQFEKWLNPELSDSCVQNIYLHNNITVEAQFSAVSVDSSKIIINEISYVNQYNSLSGDWIEIANQSGVDIPVDDWKLKIGTDTFIFEDTEFKNYEYIVITNNKNNLKSDINSQIVKFEDFELDNSGSLIEILNSKNETVDILEYKNKAPWPILSSQNDFTMELLKTDCDNSEAQNWKSSIFIGGTPGKENSPVTTGMQNITINEFMANNINTVQDDFGEFDDWIELYNKGSKKIDVRGLFITDDSSNPIKYQIPCTIEPIYLLPDNYLILWADNDNQGALHLNFKLDNDGEEIAIFQNNGYELMELDKISFNKQYYLYSFGREFDGVGSKFDDWDYLTPTPGDRNNTNTQILTPISINQVQNNYIIYPVPAKNNLNVKCLKREDSQSISVSIYDLVGKLQYTQQLFKDENIFKIDISELNPGIYVLKIKDEMGGYFMEKFFKIK